MTKDEEIAQLKESLAAEREFRDACEVGYEAEIKQLRAQLAAAQAAIRAHEERRGYRCEVGGGDAVELFAAISAAVAEAQKPLVDVLTEIRDSQISPESIQHLAAVALAKVGK